MKSACVLIECPITKMVLAVSRKDDYGAWGLPGGKVEEGQTEEEAARAELRQETGIVLYRTWGNTCRLVEVFRREGGVTFRAETRAISDVVERAAGETGRVAWVTRQQLIEGPFGEYNNRLFEEISDNKDVR